MNEEVLLTQDGYDKIVEEHEYLVSVRRIEVSEHLKEAKSYGDLSENAEYDAAKNEQAELEERISKLEYMMRNANQILSREQITQRVWGYDADAEYNNVDVYVSFLRKKMKFVQSAAKISAVRGVGYELEAEE